VINHRTWASSPLPNRRHRTRSEFRCISALAGLRTFGITVAGERAIAPPEAKGWGSRVVFGISRYGCVHRQHPFPGIPERRRATQGIVTSFRISRVPASVRSSARMSILAASPPSDIVLKYRESPGMTSRGSSSSV